MRGVIIAGLLACLLAGCAPATVQEMRQSHAGKVELSVSRSLESTYRSAVDYAMEFRGQDIERDLFTDTREAQVSITQMPFLSPRQILLHADLKESEGRTSVTIYYPTRPWKRNAEEWAKVIAESAPVK